MCLNARDIKVVFTEPFFMYEFFIFSEGVYIRQINGWEVFKDDVMHGDVMCFI